MNFARRRFLLSPAGKELLASVAEQVRQTLLATAVVPDTDDPLSGFETLCHDFVVGCRSAAPALEIDEAALRTRLEEIYLFGFAPKYASVDRTRLTRQAVTLGVATAVIQMRETGLPHGTLELRFLAQAREEFRLFWRVFDAEDSGCSICD